ncbi:hypothetical protein AALO_G00088910 [Alosa alosa]|uniref:Uncharacterized protein n=1 Tax=Alosa alosa TaxID=278164 RepID=A0AAV6H1C1_9TELE|nr:hypothetical protein AALO_G00088910 [Alosa alosa]
MPGRKRPSDDVWSDAASDWPMSYESESEIEFNVVGDNVIDEFWSYALTETDTSDEESVESAECLGEELREWEEYITEWVAEYDSYEKARRKLVKFCKGNGLESTDEDSVRKRVPSSKYVGFRSTSAPPSAASGRPPVQASTSRLHTETMERPKKKLCNNGAKSQTLPAIPPFPFPPSTPETVPDLRQDERELRLFQMLEEIKGQVRQKFSSASGNFEKRESLKSAVFQILSFCYKILMI